MLLLLLATGGVLPLGVVFWIVLLIAIIFGGWVGFAPTGPTWRPWALSFVVLVELFLLGWKVFGFPIGGS